MLILQALPDTGKTRLVRPGRSFATVRTRALNRGEALALLRRLGKTGPAVLPDEPRVISLAELYRRLEV